MLRKMKPLIVILGATGTGKSKLAIELACHFNGEIISADSMQVYQGLDIVTNKVTREERSMCPHHMIDFVSPLKSNYTVSDFKNTSLQLAPRCSSCQVELTVEHLCGCFTKARDDIFALEDIWRRDKLPVIVGGTNYYIESLLWNFVIQEPVSQQASSDEEGCKNVAANAAHTDGDTVEQSGYSANQGDSQTLHNLNLNNFQLPWFDRDLSAQTSELYDRLKQLDTPSALSIHPNDRRKIQRALQVLRQTGMTRSKHLEKQQNGISHDDMAVSGALRYPDTRMIWLQCEPVVLNERLDKRVDDMINAGLVTEMLCFHKQYNQQEDAGNQCRDYTLGIFQTIGFKEFHKYLLLSDQERSTERGSQLLQEGVDAMKLATRKYARRQLKWIVGRFQKRRLVEVPPVYAVDATVVSDWDANVLRPSTEVVSALLQGKTAALNPLKREEGPSNHLYKECVVCNVTAISRTNWEAHVNGRRHKKRVASRRKAERDLCDTLTVYSQQHLNRQQTVTLQSGLNEIQAVQIKHT